MKVTYRIKLEKLLTGNGKSKYETLGSHNQLRGNGPATDVLLSHNVRQGEGHSSEGETTSVARSHRQTPEFVTHSSGQLSDQVQYESAIVHTSNVNQMNVGTPGVAFMRQGPILGSEISLPHFANGKNENPVQFINLLDDYFLLKATSEFQRHMIIKSALGGSVLSWFQIFIEPGTSYDSFKDIFISYFWDSHRQNQVKHKLEHGKYEARGKNDMAEHLIELAQLARLLNPPLEDHIFLEMAINQYPQEVRNALIVAKPASIVEAVKLVKKLQGRKNLETNSEISLGQQSLYRRPSSHQNHAQSPGSGADPTRPTTSAQVHRDMYENVTHESGDSPAHHTEWNRSGPQYNENNWQGPTSGPNYGHQGQQNFRQEVTNNHGRNGQYRGRQNGGPYSNRPPRINYFQARPENFQSGRQRPYWIRRNVSNGYYRPRTGRGRGRARWNNASREQDREPNHEGAVGHQGPIQQRVDENAQIPRENEVVVIPNSHNVQSEGNGPGRPRN